MRDYIQNKHQSYYILYIHMAFQVLLISFENTECFLKRVMCEDLDKTKKKCKTITFLKK